MDKLAGDVTLEGSMLDGDVQGADAIRAVIGGVRELYDRQDFNFAGPWGDNGFIEDYTAEVLAGRSGASTSSPSTPTAQTQRIAAHYRPPSSPTFFSPPATRAARRNRLRRALPRRRGLNGHDRDRPPTGESWRLPTERSAL